MKNSVLIIEDDKLLSHSLAKNFNSVGIEAITASKWQEALDVLETNERIGIIFLDYLLPEKNGFELLKEIKTNEDLKEIPVIFLTNIDNEEIANTSKENGATGYLIKSNISIDTLVDLASQHIEVPEIKL